MSFNPDDVAGDEQEKLIQSLRNENEDLKKKIEDLSRRLAVYENSGNAMGAAGGPVLSEGGAEATVGRKSLPFARRNSKQHQGRMTYLLKKLEMGTSQQWTQDAIADLHTYCTSEPDFFKKAVVAYSGDDHITDMDVFIAMLQSH
jgi:hypothetical protein